MQRVPTGIHGLDELVDGGLPAKRCVLLSGAPGTGKTTFCSEFLYHGIIDHNEAGVFVTLDQNPATIIEDMVSLGLDLQGLVEKRKLIMVDASPVRGKVTVMQGIAGHRLASSGIQEFSVQGLIIMIKEAIDRSNAKRIVLDSLTGLMARYSENFMRRLELMHLLHELTYLNCTVLLTSELLTNDSFEAYSVDGIILLKTLPLGRGVVKVIEVSKLRGSKHDSRLHPYALTEKGIVIHAEDEIFDSWGSRY